MPNNLSTMTAEEVAEHNQRAEEYGHEAQHLYALICASARKDVQRAKECGDYLIKAKFEVELAQPGRWEHWMREHFPRTSDQTLRGYMRIARTWGRYEATSIDAYLKCIAHDERRATRGHGCTAAENTGWPRSAGISSQFSRQFAANIRSMMTSWMDNDAIVFLATDGEDLWNATLEKIGDLLEVECRETLQPPFAAWKERRDRERAEHERRTTPVVRRRIGQHDLAAQTQPVEEGAA